MSTVIQIKRSASGLAPNTLQLAQAELAYSQDASNDGANAILYIESIDNASNPVIHKLGGKYYTDIVDTATASNTPDKLVKRDAAGGFSGNLYGRANVSASLDSTYVNNVLPGLGITVTGTLAVPSANLTVNLANTTVTPGSYGGAASIPTVIIDETGRVTFAANNSVAASSFTIRGNSGTDTFSTGNTLDVIGVSPGISTAVTDNTISITNTGVTGLTSAGHGIVFSGSSGNITTTFTGVGSVVGTTNEIEVTSGPTGNVQIGLPDNITVGNNLTVTGNLFVLGDAVTVNTATITVEDPLVKFGNSNPGDILDIGFYGQYESSGTKFAGLFRDATDGLFKLFKDLDSDPTDNVIAEPNYTLATLKTNLTAGNITSLVNALAVDSGGTGLKTLTANTVMVGDFNAVRLVAGTSGQILQYGADGMIQFAGLDGGSY